MLVDIANGHLGIIADLAVRIEESDQGVFTHLGTGNGNGFPANGIAALAADAEESLAVNDNAGLGVPVNGT